MAFLGFGKKKEEVKENTSCCCGDGECGIKSVKVLGTGCTPLILMVGRAHFTFMFFAH